MIRQVEQQYAEQELEPSSSLREEAATRSPREKNSELKKQSQSVPGLNGAKSFMKGDYDNMPTRRIEENKAKQSQLHESVLAKVAGKRKKPATTANRLTG